MAIEIDSNLCSKCPNRHKTRLISQMLLICDKPLVLFSWVHILKKTECKHKGINPLLHGPSSLLHMVYFEVLNTHVTERTEKNAEITSGNFEEIVFFLENRHKMLE